MKIYHGTSFENACKILSKDTWEFPIELELKSHYDICNKMGKDYDFKRHISLLEERGFMGNHFTTSLNHAKSYAMQQEKPVVLFLDIEMSGPCIDFIVSDPIDTSKVKCIEAYINGLYGPLCNVLYNKKSKYGYSIVKNNILSIEQ